MLAVEGVLESQKELAAGMGRPVGKGVDVGVSGFTKPMPASAEQKAQDDDKRIKENNPLFFLSIRCTIINNLITRKNCTSNSDTNYSGDKKKASNSEVF